MVYGLWAASTPSKKSENCREEEEDVEDDGEDKEK